MPGTNQSKAVEAELLKLLQSTKPLQSLTEDEVRSIIKLLVRKEYKTNDIVLQEGDIGTAAYIVAAGEFSFAKMERVIKIFKPGDFFGEIAIIDARPRTGTVKAVSDGVLYVFEGAALEDENRIAPRTARKIYQGFARLITSYVREGSDLYREMDVLLVQDGGCAPGYNPVTAFLTEYLEKEGRKVFVAAQGFRSLVSNRADDYRCLIHHMDYYKQIEHIPGVIFAPPLREARGADFRSERYPDFREEEQQRKAAEHIVDRKVNILIGIGGNGTFMGIKALSHLLPDTIQSFFIPVTIDSDLYGTDCIGEHTGVEIGAEKIRCYMADARTHKRCYIIEMMGAQGGYHALHSCLGARAHLAVLPSSQYDIRQIAEAMRARSETVIVVAEGYKSRQRKEENYRGNAAEYFRDELLSTGISMKHRIICEPFSRDIRGAHPNNMDIMLAQRMARTLVRLVKEGKSKKMPAVLSGKEYAIEFRNVKTDNSVQSSLADLANRL